jgi:hypothetical protein
MYQQMTSVITDIFMHSLCESYYPVVVNTSETPGVETVLRRRTEILTLLRYWDAISSRPCRRRRRLERHGRSASLEGRRPRARCTMPHHLSAVNRCPGRRLPCRRASSRHATRNHSRHSGILRWDVPVAIRRALRAPWVPWIPRSRNGQRPSARQRHHRLVVSP